MLSDTGPGARGSRRDAPASETLHNSTHPRPAALTSAVPQSRKNGRHVTNVNSCPFKGSARASRAPFYIAQAEYEPTFNAAPSQMLPIIRTYRPDTIELARWGFWPEEWKRTKRVRPQINARLETAATKPMFASSAAT
jgi:putative SOS response-associated peptidase YedK